MTLVELSPLLRSPRLPDYVATLTEHMRIERAARDRFRDEMSEDDKVEFINGVVVVQPPAMNRHMTAQQNMAVLLDTHVTRHAQGAIRYGRCLCEFPRNDYEPDIVFFRSEKSAHFLPDTMLFPVPDLVVEVLSDSTEHRDRGVKFDDYEAHGVGEYWLIDAGTETVEQYVLDGTAFQLRLKSGSGEIVSEVVSGFRIPIRAIFDSQVNRAALGSLLK